MTEFFLNPLAVFWTAIAAMVVVPALAHYWRKMRRDELDAGLKTEMIRRGMSADEIIQVLKAGVEKDDD